MTDRIAALRERDFALYLSLWLVPPARRAFALALFDLEAELRSVPAKVKEPTIGLMRIVWWRDAVAAMETNSATRTHPLLQALQPQLHGHIGTVAEWVETFDLPFLPEADQAERLTERHELESGLIGKVAANFLRQSDNQSRIRLIIKAFWLAIRR